MKYFSIVKHMVSILEEGSFQAYIIYGNKGRGKSTYAIKALAQFYVRHGYRVRDAYHEALKSLGFTAFDIIKLIEEGRRVIIWDDAGVWLSTYMWFDPRYREYVEVFMDYWDVIRTDASIVIFTVPTKYKLPPKIRDDPSAILISISKVGTQKVGSRVFQMSKAEAAQNIESLYRDKVLRTTLWEDYFIVKLPDEIYERYRAIREKYAGMARKRLRDITKKVFGEELYISLEP